MIYLAGVIASVALLLLWLMRRDNKKTGQLESQVESYEHVLENIKQANAVRDRMRSDPAFSKRVSDKYRRD